MEFTTGTRDIHYRKEKEMSSHPNSFFSIYPKNLKIRRRKSIERKAKDGDGLFFNRPGVARAVIQTAS